MVNILQSLINSYYLGLFTDKDLITRNTKGNCIHGTQQKIQAQCYIAAQIKMIVSTV